MASNTPAGIDVMLFSYKSLRPYVICLQCANMHSQFLQCSEPPEHCTINGRNDVAPHSTGCGILVMQFKQKHAYMNVISGVLSKKYGGIELSPLADAPLGQ